MKKWKALLLTVCMTALCAGGFAACNKQNVGESTPPVNSSSSTASTPEDPEKLATPVVTLTGNTASWDADEHAERFELSIDGSLSYMENTVTSKTLENGQSFKIRAIGNGTVYATSDWSNVVTYTATEVGGGGNEEVGGGGNEEVGGGGNEEVGGGGGGEVTADAPTYLGIYASKEEPTAQSVKPTSYYGSGVRSVNDALKAYYENGANAEGQATPTASAYDLYARGGETVYVQIWLNNPEQCTILSLRLNGTKHQAGGTLKSYFYADNTNCVYVELTIPAGTYRETAYTVTEIEYVEKDSVQSNGAMVLLDGKDTAVSIGLPYAAYPTVESELDLEIGCHSASGTVTVTDAGNLAQSQGYWLRAAVFDGENIMAQALLAAGEAESVSFSGLQENTEYTFVVFYAGDKNDGNGVSYYVLQAQTFTTNAVLTVDEYFFKGELFTDNGANAAKIDVMTELAYDAEATYDRLEIYDGETLVRTDEEYEGFSEYVDLQSNTEYTVKIYYSSETHGYEGQVVEMTVTTPKYELPEIDAYGSDNSVVVGNHALFGFEVERYTDLKYYEVVLRAYEQNDAYFAPYIVELLDDSTLLDRLREKADRLYWNHDYVWEAEQAMREISAYERAQEHKDRSELSDDEWRALADSSEQYVYELTVENDGLFIANDDWIMYNYYAVLRDYFAYEELQMEILLRVDLGDGAGVRELRREYPSPYLNGFDAWNYGYELQESETARNAYVFTETNYEYKLYYVDKIELYKDGEFVCEVPFVTTDVKEVDTDAWLAEWIAKLKCEIPDASTEEMLAAVGANAVRTMFDSLDFYPEGSDGTTVDGNGNVSMGGNGLGNTRERALLTELGTFDENALLSLFAAETGVTKTLAEYIAESDNQAVVNVLTAYRTQTQITAENMANIYAALDGVYGFAGDLKSAYEQQKRAENEDLVVRDRVEEIEAASFDFSLVGLGLEVGEYEARILCRSIFPTYAEGEVEMTRTENVRFKAELVAPQNVQCNALERRITWDAVEYADGYYIYVNGEQIGDTWESSYQFYDSIKHGDNVQIRAYGYNAYESELSEEVTYNQPQLSAPVIEALGRNVTWAAVENATKYYYTINDGEERETWDTNICVPAGATVKVRAVDENGVCRDSAWSNSVTVTSGSADKG